MSAFNDPYKIFNKSPAQIQNNENKILQDFPSR